MKVRSGWKALILLLSSALATPVAAASTEVRGGSAEASAGAAGRRAPVVFDAGALREGRFTYRLSVDAKPIGVATIEIRATGGHYRISFSSTDIGQTWSSTLTRRFEPLAATLEFSGGRAPYSMSIRYAAGRATGSEVTTGAETPFAIPFDTQVIDQRVDWAGMMAAVFDGPAIEVQVVDPKTSLSRLVGTSIETSPLGGVLGTLPTVRLDYTITKASHTESYSVFATRDRPRVMLREEMPGNLVAVLVAIES